MGREFKKGTIVKHFKRNLFYKKFPNQKDSEEFRNMYLYKIICTGTNTETGERMMVYQAMYDDLKVWIRPYDMFVSKVDKTKYPDVTQEYRFEPYEKE